jgi:hypothetical protein
MGAPVTGGQWTWGEAYGAINLTATLENGRISGDISISLDVVSSSGAGIYTVTAVTESSSNSVVLGTVDVPTMKNTYILQEPGYTEEIPGGEGNADFRGAGSRLPGRLNPFDIAAISISDSNGNIITTTHISPVQIATYTATSRPEVVRADPSSSGFALIHDDTVAYVEPAVLAGPVSGMLSVSGTIVLSGSVQIGQIPTGPPQPPLGGYLVIHAHGLRRNAKLTYALDGTDIGTVTTDAGGNLTLSAAQASYDNTGPIPATVNLFEVKRVTVHDASGRVFFCASF